MRMLRLTNKQLEVLKDVIQDTVQSLEDDLITYEDEEGNEVEEKIEDYEVYKIYEAILDMQHGGNHNDTCRNDKENPTMGKGV